VDHGPLRPHHLIGLLDDLNAIAAAMRIERDRVKVQVDDAKSGLSATNAYGQAGRLGQKRQAPLERS
jgi:hypothetical protein